MKNYSSNNDFLRPDFFDNFVALLEKRKPKKIYTEISNYHPSEIASFIQILKKDHRRKLFKILENKFDSRILVELDPEFLKTIIDEIDFKIIFSAIKELESDEAVSILKILDFEKRNEILSNIPEEIRTLFEDNLSYPENSAGKLMQVELIKVSVNDTVGEIIDLLRKSKNLPKVFYDLFVTDNKNKFLGTIPLSTIITSLRKIKVLDIMKKNEKSVHFLLDQEDVADLFRKRNLTSVAVVDNKKRLLGSINIEDVVDVIDDEAEEDLLKLAGVGEQSFYGAIVNVTKSRFTWLFFNLFAAFFASYVIKNFENTIANLAILAALMPIIASMGGCSGTQSLTTAVRALAMKQLTLSNSYRAVFKEVLIGFLNGIIFSSLAFILTKIWFNDIKLSIVISASLFINLIFGTFFGVFIPILLTRLKIDPAVASGTFVTMLTDIFGFFLFLTLATIYLI